MSTENLKVYAAINAVQQAMAKEGIAKDSRNQQQGYAFRGIDSVYCALAPHLAANKLCILPRVMSRHVDEKQTKSGGVLFYTTLMVEFDFVSAEDGSKHTVCTVGEAMDSGDKSSNKAMSAAYKYAAFQAFCIPTEGDNDADATTHEPADKKPVELPAGATRVPALISDESIAFFKLADPALVKRVIDGYKKTAFTELTEAQAQKGITFIKAEMSKAEATKKKEEKEPF